DTSDYVRDGFSWTWEIRYKVLEFTNGAYSVRNYKDSLDTVIGSEGSLSLRGNNVEELPFTFVNSKDILAIPDQPPLQSLAEMCIGIYQAEADYRQHLHYQAQETLVVKGGVRGGVQMPEAPDTLRVGA